MNTTRLSDECLDRLGLYVDVDEENYEEFIFYAGLCVYWIRDKTSLSGLKRNKKDAQNRIDKVKKAFNALTDMDKLSLDLHISLYDDDNYDYQAAVRVIESLPLKSNCTLDTSACEKMQWALDKPVPKSIRHNVPRKNLIAFAKQAIDERWVDVSVNNAVLIELIKILMEEAGVHHDADAIAKAAKITVLQEIAKKAEGGNSGP